MAKLAKATRKSRHEVVQLGHPDLLQFVHALVTGTRILMFLGYAPSSLLGGNKSSRILMVWYMHKTIRVGEHFQPHALRDAEAPAAPATDTEGNPGGEEKPSLHVFSGG